MSTYPILTNTLANGIGQGGNGRTFQRVSGDSTYEYYQLHDASGGAIGGINDYSIKVHKANNAWSDHGANSPMNLFYNTTTLNVEMSDGSPWFYFVKPTSAPWITPPPAGPGTLSTADTASFAETTPQQIQWAITNGSSPVANTNYYLFNETPGGNALDTINLGSNPQVGSTSTHSYINPSGADFTGKWYIGYGQNSTRVNLKVYDFSSRKVFCNFW